MIVRLWGIKLTSGGGSVMHMLHIVEEGLSIMHNVESR